MKSETQNQIPAPSHFADSWMLDPAVVFLNHGSFGACPLPVLEAQQRWRVRMEQQPLQFLGADIEPLLDAARRQLAAFVGADEQDLVFVPNATTAVNAVLRSLRFQPGDELLTTTQEYNACRNALNYVAEREGLQIQVAEVPFPIESPQVAIAAIRQQVSAKTRLVLLDHITSQTGLIFPIQELVQELSALGIDTLIDGAHALGMVPLQLSQLGATYYTGNCHKWLCAPKGSAFLYVQRDRQPLIRPLTISHGANAVRPERSRFHLEFDWMGTDDPTAHLTVPAAIQFMGSLLPGGWQELMQTNRSLAIAARQILCEALEVPLPCPDTMLGSLAAVPLPPEAQAFSWQALHDLLLQQYQIEVPIIPWGDSGGKLIRISAQIYNSLDQYHFLATALTQVFRDRL